MNSTNLKKTFYKVYGDFFLQNSLVFSTPFVMNWSGDLLSNYSGISIKQKIPLRMYIGCNKNSSGKITLGNIVYQDFDNQNCIESPLREYAPYFNDIDSYIQTHYKHLVEKYGGIEINMLSELPRGVGLGFGSILALLFSLLFNALEDETLSTSLSSYIKNNINESLSDEFSPFSKIIKTARELDSHIYNMISSGTKFASFFYSYYPIISFSQDFEYLPIKSDSLRNKYFGFRFHDMFKNLSEVPYSPIDYGLIYSGKPVLLEQIAGDNYKNNAMLSSQIRGLCMDLFGDYLDNIAPSQRPKFYKHLVQPEVDEFQLTYGKLMGIISLKILYFMSKMYSNGYDETNMLNFLDGLKKIKEGDVVTRHSSSVFMSFIKKFTEKFSGSSKYLSLAPNDTTIMGGSLIFSMPLEGFRVSLNESVQAMRNEFSSSKLLYANWIDGVEYEGSICEQDLQIGIFSEFIAHNSCCIRWTSGKMVVGEYESLLEKYQTGLVLDTINNKIYLHGERLTSQDLHSQSATIEILKILINNASVDIHNTQLPISSYSKNKNEMFGKIIIPLIDLIENRCKKKLPLICKGSIYDFYLKLNHSDIDIAIIEELKKVNN